LPTAIIVRDGTTKLHKREEVKSMSVKSSYEEGYAKGREYAREIESYPSWMGFVDPFGIIIPNEPHRSGDTAYNEGVKQGVKDEKSKR
jgi:hypothetical protein